MKENKQFQSESHAPWDTVDKYTQSCHRRFKEVPKRFLFSELNIQVRVHPLCTHNPSNQAVSTVAL